MPKIPSMLQFFNYILIFHFIIYIALCKTKIGYDYGTVWKGKHNLFFARNLHIRLHIVNIKLLHPKYICFCFLLFFS